MVCVDPYLNATTRHADVILPPPSVLEKSHYDLAFTGAVGAQRGRLLAAGVRAGAGTPSEFEILVRLAAIAAGLGADADPDALADATVAGRMRRGGRRSGVIDSRPRPGRDRGGARRPAGRGAAPRPPPPHRASRRRVRRAPGGLSLELLEAHPHGIDFGPLEPRLPDALATESGKVELAPAQLVDDLARLESALAVTAAGGMVLVGRRQLRTANSWTQNVQVLVRGKDSCVAQLIPTTPAGSGSSTAPPRRSARPPARSSSRGGHRRGHARRRLHPVRLGSRPAGHAPGSRHGHAGVNVNILTDASSSTRSRATPCSTASRSPSRPPSGRRRDYRPPAFVTLLRSPVSREELEPNSMFERSMSSAAAASARQSLRACRARRRARRARPGARAALRPRPRDRRGGGVRRPRAVGRARQRRDAARGARAAHAPLQRPSAADVHACGAAPEQLDGAWGAVTAESDEARAVATWLAEMLGLRPFALDDERRALYHAGAAIASNYLVTLRRAAGSLLETAGAPPEALDPLMRRTIENGFELTGPIQRGDWATVERHLEAIRAPAGARGAVPRPRRGDGGASMKTCRTIAEARGARAAPRRHDRPRADDGRAARGHCPLLARRAGGVRDRRR